MTIANYFSAMEVVLLMLMTCIVDVHTLKDVKVTIPLAVRSMDTVTFQCKYDLEGEPLYTVKWYKGAKEFYRFIPKELPNTQVFPLRGIDVDLSKSTSNEVVLRNVQPDVTGRYSCEVSSDAPNFYTLTVSGYMYVIDVPEDDLEMSISKMQSELGHILIGNCTTPASYPPMNVSWYLNGNKIDESHLKRLKPYSTSEVLSKSKRAPVISTTLLELEIDDNIFVDGIARLRCVVTLFTLYDKTKEDIWEDDRPKPRPSSMFGTPGKSSVSQTAVQVGIMAVSLFICEVR